VTDVELFRMTGTSFALEQALDRLRDQGWEVLGEPEAGPLDTWLVRVRRAEVALA
jgi:hypothetical protein